MFNSPTQNNRCSINCHESRSFDPFTPSFFTIAFGIIILIFEIFMGFLDVDRIMKYVDDEFIFKCQSVNDWLTVARMIDFSVPFVTLCYVLMNLNIKIVILCLFQIPVFIMTIWCAIIEATIKSNTETTMNKPCFDLIASQGQDNIWVCTLSHYLVIGMIIMIYCIGLLEYCNKPGL